MIVARQVPFRRALSIERGEMPGYLIDAKTLVGVDADVEGANKTVGLILEVSSMGLGDVDDAESDGLKGRVSNSVLSF